MSTYIKCSDLPVLFILNTCWINLKKAQQIGNTRILVKGSFKEEWTSWRAMMLSSKEVTYYNWTGSDSSKYNYG